MNSSWKPVSFITAGICIIAAVGFWIYALADKGGFLFLDWVNLPFHEFGHLFFGLFGERVGIWGGTIMQLAIPLGILVNFLLRKETLGVTFSSFWFGENFLNIAVYVADARRMQLPLVGGGEHDWNTILSGMSMLQSDSLIAALLKIVGWVIMFTSMVWLVIVCVKTRRSESEL